MESNMGDAINSITYDLIKPRLNEAIMTAKATMEAAGIEIVTLPEADIEAIFQKLLVWLEEEFKPMTPRTELMYNITMEALADFGRI